MTWHLKDRELEKKLIERFPSFVYELGKHCESSENFNFSVKLCRKGFCYYTDEMTFSKDELEEVPEYNPKAWNDSRKVNPPNDVVFRAEIHQISISGHKWVNYQCLIYKDNKWFFFRDGRDAERVFLEDVEYIMFRPWEN